jgi:hypothetical protein
MVRRHFEDWRITSAQVDLRNRFAQHLKVPRSHLEEGGRLLSETYVSGRLFNAVDGDTQIQALKQLFRSFANLARAEGRGSTRRLIEPMVQRLNVDVLPLPFRKTLGDGRLPEKAENWPRVPCPGCGKETNIILDQEGSSVFIDCFPLAYWPFFFGPVFLAKSTSATLDAFEQGGLDLELKDLFRAVGLSIIPDAELRRDLMVVTFLVRAMRTKEVPRYLKPAETMLRLYHALDRAHLKDHWKMRSTALAQDLGEPRDVSD